MLIFYQIFQTIIYRYFVFRPDRDDYIDVNDNLIDYSAIMAWKIKNVKFGETYEVLVLMNDYKQ